MSTQKHSQFLEKVTACLLPERGRFEAEISDVISLGNKFREKIRRFEDEAQRLNIAVMGQVKAGKSSFLNALLFDGRPVLPEASTPKTANLTRISWGESYRLEVEYYTSDDWSSIEAAAKEEGSHAEAKVARELVAMAERAKIKGINVHDLLGTRKEDSFDSIEGLLGELNHYVGNDGELVAFVKMTRLYLPLPELQGFDVVDTPGMNDPVISRIEKTKQEMARSDVVFFLSRCSQFLDSSDTDLLARQLPGNGVKRIYLIGGQFDSAILDDGYDRTSLAETETNLKRRLGSGAKERLSALAKQREAIHPEHAKLLHSMTEPVFSSTFAHGFASWPQDRWNQNMQHVFSEIQSMAQSNWKGYTLTSDDWTRLANFQPLKKAYEQARADKQIILKQQQEGLLPEARQQLQEALSRLRESVDTRILTLQKNDIADLNRKANQCEQRLHGISGRLAEVINEALDKADKTSRDILSSLKKGQAEYGQLQERTGTRTETDYYTVSTSKWYKPWTWGNTESRSSTTTVSYSYLAASDAIENLCQYAADCSYQIESEFNRIISRDALRLTLRSCLLAEMDAASKDFDPSAFRRALAHVIDRLDIPQLELDISNVADLIGAEFSGQIKDDGMMDALRETLKRSLQKVYADLQKRLQSAAKKLENELAQLRDSLDQELTRQVREELASVKVDFDNKELALKDNQSLLELVEGFLKESELSELT
jgi:hypothetical protein